MAKVSVWNSSQNDYGDRISSPYCPRAYHTGIYQRLLDWKEIKAGLDPSYFNIKTTGKRLEKKGDLWAGILDKEIMIKLEAIAAVFVIQRMVE